MPGLRTLPPCFLLSPLQRAYREALNVPDLTGGSLTGRSNEQPGEHKAAVRGV